MAVLRKMQVTSGAGTGQRAYVFKSNPLLYQNIAAQVGITPVEDANKAAPIARIEDLLLYGILESLTVFVGSTATTRKSVYILCDAEQLATAKTGLIGKTIPQGTITSVSEGLKSQNYI